MLVKSLFALLLLPCLVSTCIRSDFVPYEVSQRPVKQRAEYQPNPGEIDLATTYSQEFVPFELQPVLPRLPKERIQHANGKLDTVPTYTGNTGVCGVLINASEGLFFFLFMLYTGIHMED